MTNQSSDDIFFFWFSFLQIMGNQIHSFVISDKYAARVSNPYMYDIIRCVTVDFNNFILNFL